MFSPPLLTSPRPRAAGGIAGPGQLWHAGTFVLIGGLVICLITMATGFWDLIRLWPGNSGDPADDAPDQLRTVAAHVSVMAAAFMIGAGDVAWRLSDYGSRASTPPGVVALSLTAAIVACTGGYFGGKLVFAHAMGVDSGRPQGEFAVAFRACPG